MKIDEIKEELGYSYPDNEIIIFENPDYSNAFLGVSNDYKAVYDYNKMIECLESEDGMDYEEAAEFIDYNTIRALPYMGPNAPIIVYPLEA